MKTTVYENGTILTMEEPLYAEALAVRDGKILYAGSREQALLLAGEDCVRVDLKGHTLMPSFIDGHSHLVSFASSLAILPLSGAKSFDDIVSMGKAYLEQKHPAPGEWVTGFGYDNNFLKEQAHPDRHLLDRISAEVPILIAHASGHMGVTNTKGLELLGITADTPDPEGGRFGRINGGREPDGFLEETAFTSLAAQMPAADPEKVFRQVEDAQKVYLSYGITTIQDGFTKKKDWDLLCAMADRGKLQADVVSYIDLLEWESLWKEEQKRKNRYEGRLKMGGFKVFLDGSPQGRTAWMSRPYLGGEEGYCGYPIYTDEKLTGMMKTALADGAQLLAHCNGDAAAEQMVRCYEQALDGRTSDTRPVMIHAQLVRKDQLHRMAKLGMMASFFTAHTYYWGDVHRKNFGEERACRISPAHTAAEEGVQYTFHQDSPVLYPDMMKTVWCAVNRRSKGNQDMGKEERISVLEALKAITVQAAYQYSEEDRKGTLRAGKLADLVILEENPLTVPPEHLAEVRVLETIKEGKTLYRRGE